MDILADLPLFSLIAFKEVVLVGRPLHSYVLVMVEACANAVLPERNIWFEISFGSIFHCNKLSVGLQ
jgi:hypothetical protein